MTPEPQYATSSPSGSSGCGSAHGALSAPGIRPGGSSIGFGSPRQRFAVRASTSTSDGSASRARDLRGVDRVARALARHELGRLDLLVAAAQRAAPGVEPADEHGAVVVAEVPEQPPEPLGAAERAVGDDEHAGADARARRRGGERAPPRAAGAGPRPVTDRSERSRRRRGTRRRECARRGRARRPAAGRAELPAAVDELRTAPPASLAGDCAPARAGSTTLGACAVASGRRRSSCSPWAASPCRRAAPTRTSGTHAHADRIATGVTIAGIDVGGLDAPEAGRGSRTRCSVRLAQAGAARLRRPHDSRVDPRSAGLQRGHRRAWSRAPCGLSRSGGLAHRLLRDVARRAAQRVGAARGRRLAAHDRDARRPRRARRRPAGAQRRASCRSRSRPGCASSRREPASPSSGRSSQRALARCAPAHRRAAHGDRPDTRRAARAGGRRRSSGATARCILVSRETFTLRLFKRLKLVKTYRIAVGRAGLETPAGFYEINDKQVNPSWHVPHERVGGRARRPDHPARPRRPDQVALARLLQRRRHPRHRGHVVARLGRLARVHADGDPRRRAALRPRAAAHARSTSAEGCGARRAAALAAIRPHVLDASRGAIGRPQRSALRAARRPLRVARSTGTGVAHVHVGVMRAPPSQRARCRPVRVRGRRGAPCDSGAVAAGNRDVELGIAPHAVLVHVEALRLDVRRRRGCPRSCSAPRGSRTTCRT